MLQACFLKHLPPILRAGLVFPGTPQLPASFALVPQGGLEPHYVTGDDTRASTRAHAIGPRHIYACRLSGCQASLPSALPPLSHPAEGAGLSRLSSCRFCVCFNTDDERLPRVRIPIRFRGVSRASTLWAYLWARIRSVRAVAL